MSRLTPPAINEHEPVFTDTKKTARSHAICEQAMDVLASLRLGTGSAHQALHHHPALQKLDTGVELSEEYLHHALCKFYGFHAGIEQRIHETAHAEIYKQLATPILDNLENDICLFNANSLATVQNYPADDVFSETEAIWAYLYVKEGSLLGGRVIHKTLTKHLPEYNHSYKYFAGLQDKTAQHWKTFTQTLIHETKTLNARRIVSHANALFEDLYKWMN